MPANQFIQCIYSLLSGEIHLYVIGLMAHLEEVNRTQLNTCDLSAFFEWADDRVIMMGPDQCDVIGLMTCLFPLNGLGIELLRQGADHVSNWAYDVCHHQRGQGRVITLGLNRCT